MATDTATPPSTSTSADEEQRGSGSCSSFWGKVLSGTKMTCSIVLILFSVVVVSVAIFTKQTVATAEYGVHPIVALCVFWFSMAWLAILEGGLNAMVGLQPIPKDLYKTSHHKAYLCTRAAHRGNQIERFIVGRQYLDLTIVFTTSFMVSAIDNAQVLGLPQIVNDIFLGGDLAVILCTIVFGQLVSVINCSHSMLDYINNWCMVASTYLALFVEATGILHAVYFVQIIFTKIANRNKHKKNKSKSNVLKRKQSDVMDGNSTSDANSDSHSETSRSRNNESSSSSSIPEELEPADMPLWKRIFFWARVLFSLGISVLAVVVFVTALIGGNTTVRSEIPIPVSIVSLIILLLLGGFMEALQIALFAVKHLDQAKIEANPTARRNCHFIFKSGGYNEENDTNNVRAFLVGRQIAQTVIMFMIARIISVDMKVEGETLFGVSPKVQAVLFDSGLLNALVSTIFASLSWRVTANFFPMLYLGSPLSIWIIRLCLLVEGTGICDAAWLLAKIPAAIVGYKTDDYYLEQAAASSATGQGDLEVGGGIHKRSHKQASIMTESIDSTLSCTSEDRQHQVQHDEC